MVQLAADTLLIIHRGGSRCGRSGGGRGRTNLTLGLLAVALAVAAAPAPAAEIPATAVAERLLAGARALSVQGSPAASGRLQDWELFAVAEALASLGQDYRADQYRRYLQTYFPRSPLLRLLPPVPAEVTPLDYFEPDPDLSRWLRNIYRRLTAADPAPPAEELADMVELLRVASELPEMPPAAGPLEEFLRLRPESPWAGWAAYQLAWRSRLEASDRSGAECLGRLASEHKDHPLGEEAGEALDLRWQSPRRLALVSALVPGLSEELLEPGAHESAGALYTEALYLAGAVAFTVAAQSNARAPNLTGAVILFNLLMLNHTGSSARAYEAGFRANGGERRRFLADRLERQVSGSGRFDGGYYQPPAPEPLADDWVIDLGYRQWGAGEALRGRGWVHDDQLGNLGLRLDYLRSVWDEALAPEWTVGAGLAPYVRMFATHAAPVQDSPLPGGASVFEAGLGVEAAFLTRLDFGGSWAQVRLSLGPGYRRRTLDASGAAYGDSGAVLTGTAVLALGSASGAYWQAGACVDESFASGSFQAAGQMLSVPSRGWEIFSGLGVHF
jgi:hypothetical protein